MNKKLISLTEHFGFIRESGPVLIAVSGGSDSMALLFLANAWAKKSQRNVHAVTVDHGLRAEAASEAIYVASVCDALGIPHTTLAWDGIKPNSGISAAARQARYQLINEFALDIGVQLVLTGHNQDDQAETVLMRLRRSWGSSSNTANGSNSGRGHAGMSQRVLLGGLDVFQSSDQIHLYHSRPVLLRPLLRLTRAKLRQYLNMISQPWIEDPSNFDGAYERVRVREQLSKQPLLKQNLLEYSDVMGRMRANISHKAAGLLTRYCSIKIGRVFEVRIADLAKFGDPICILALKSIIAAAGGASFLVADNHLVELLSQTRNRAFDGGKPRQTLGNCIVENDGKYIRIYREARNLLPAIIECGESKFWDGRVHITNNGNEPIRIEALPSERLEEIVDAGLAENCSVSSAVQTALLSSPFLSTSTGASVAICVEDDCLPEGVTTRWSAKAIELFCPQWDYPLLAWLETIKNRTPHDQSLLTEGDLPLIEPNRDAPPTSIN